MSIIKEVPIFRELPQEAIDWLAERAKTRHYPKGTIVLAEGQSGNELFVIQSGRSKVFVSNSDGRELVLYHAGPGDYVGELAIMDDQPRSATVQTLEKSSFLVLNQNDMRELLGQSPDFSLVIIRALTEKVRLATNSVRSLGLDPVYKRLTDLLTSECSECPDTGDMVVQKLSHRQIAEQIGSSREMVSKLMRDLEKGGYIEGTGARIIIKSRFPSSW